MQRRRLTPEQVRVLLDLMERGLAGDFDRISIDFRDRAYYVDTWARQGQTVKQQKCAA